MKINEIISSIPFTKPIKPQSPEQMRVAALKKAADQASAAVSAEKQRQRLSKAQRAMAKLNQSR